MLAFGRYWLLGMVKRLNVPLLLAGQVLILGSSLMLQFQPLLSSLRP